MFPRGRAGQQGSSGHSSQQQAQQGSEGPAGGGRRGNERLAEPIRAATRRGAARSPGGFRGFCPDPHPFAAASYVVSPTWVGAMAVSFAVVGVAYSAFQGCIVFGRLPGKSPTWVGPCYNERAPAW